MQAPGPVHDSVSAMHNAMLLHVCKVCSSSSRVMCFLFRLPGTDLNPGSGLIGALHPLLLKDDFFGFFLFLMYFIQ